MVIVKGLPTFDLFKPNTLRMMLRQINKRICLLLQLYTATRSKNAPFCTNLNYHKMIILNARSLAIVKNKHLDTEPKIMFQSPACDTTSVSSI